MLSVMAGLVPAIHVFDAATYNKTWMPATSAGMTKKEPHDRMRHLGRQASENVRPAAAARQEGGPGFFAFSGEMTGCVSVLLPPPLHSSALSALSMVALRQ